GTYPCAASCVPNAQGRRLAGQITKRWRHGPLMPRDAAKRWVPTRPNECHCCWSDALRERTQRVANGLDVRRVSEVGDEVLLRVVRGRPHRVFHRHLADPLRALGG